MSLNSVCILGRLGQDPELKYTSNNLAVCSFSVAVSRDYAGPDGTRPTDWIDCVAWRQRAEWLCKYFHKGSLIGLRGRLETRSYEDKKGNHHKVVELIVENAYFADTKGDTPKPSKPKPETKQPEPPPVSPPPIPNDEDFIHGEPEDDLPF